MPKLCYETKMLRLKTCLRINKLIKSCRVSNEKAALKSVLAEAQKKNIKSGFEKGNSNRTYDRYLRFKKTIKKG